MNDVAPAVEKISPGQALAAARAELKLSVADVSQQIKYSVKQITAIEADEFDKLPGTTFVRGMIRSYAKLLQIDPEPLLVDLGRHDNPAAAAADLHVSGQEPFIEGGTKSNRVYILLSLVALVAVAAVAYEWWRGPLELDTGQVVTIMPKSASSDTDAAAPPTDAAPASAPAPAPAPAPAQAKAPAAAPAASAAAPAEASAAPAGTAKQQVAPAGTAKQQVAPAGTAKQQAAPAGVAKQQATPAAAAASTGPLKRIELAFDQLSWVEIKQGDGKILMSKLNQPGTTQVIEGVPPFDVVIGNAASTHLKYNDAPIDLKPFFKVDVARLKLE